MRSLLFLRFRAVRRSRRLRRCCLGGFWLAGSLAVSSGVRGRRRLLMVFVIRVPALPPAWDMWSFVCGRGISFFSLRIFGAMHNREIHSISNSESMCAWSVGGGYDRPIPRRIAEEAGIPRDAFGFRKYAGGHAAFVSDDRFSVEGLLAYERFVRESHAQVPRIRRFGWRLVTQGKAVFWRLTRDLRKRHVRSSAYQRRFPFLLNREPVHVPWKFMFLFQWSFDSLKSRYWIPDCGSGAGIS